MNVKIKKLSADAHIPEYSKPGDAGMDIVAIDSYFDEEGNIVYSTGLAIEIPEGFVGLLFPRSSNCKKDLVLSNSVGVIDSGYRGEILMKYKPVSFFANDSEETGGCVSDEFDYISVGKESTDDTFEMAFYKVGDRVGQLIIMPYPKITFEETEILSETKRGTNGYGSTGN